MQRLMQPTHILNYKSCHVHDRMRLRKPYPKDTLPIQLYILCNHPFCVNHKGKEDGVCEINHKIYYQNHPATQKYLYRTYEDWKKDSDKMMINKMSAKEE
ncbi:hypothetical protein BJX70DRAFT_408478 [Aspergillus crustosus]